MCVVFTLRSAPSKIIDSLTLAPAPIMQLLPIDTFGPSLAVGSTTAVGWINTSPGQKNKYINNIETMVERITI